MTIQGISWSDWRTGECDPFDPEELTGEMRIFMPATLTPSQPPTPNHYISELLASPLAEVRLIGKHMLAGADGHPFKTGDVYADTRPLDRSYRSSD